MVLFMYKLIIHMVRYYLIAFTNKINMLSNSLKEWEAQSRTPAKRGEWALIYDQKVLEDHQTRRHEQIMNQEKRRLLKEHLQEQIREKASKEQAFKLDDLRYAEASYQKARQGLYEQEQKRRLRSDTRRKMQSQNKILLNGILSDQSKQKTKSHSMSMDIGYESQLERSKRREEDRKMMKDELDRQIETKERQKSQMKQQQRLYDHRNLSYQIGKYDTNESTKRPRYAGPHPVVYEQYQNIAEKRIQKEYQFQRNQVEQAGRQKYEQQGRLSEQKDMARRYQTQKMKEMLEEQIKSKELRKKEEEKVNPQELTYGSIGRMLNQPRPEYNKRNYYEELRKQIQEKERRKQSEKYMTEEEYRLNLNQLNRVVEGKYLKDDYVDRSIQALSDSHKVNTAVIGVHVENEEAREVRRKLEEIKSKNLGKTNDLSNSH